MSPEILCLDGKILLAYPDELSADQYLTERGRFSLWEDDDWKPCSDLETRSN